MMVDFELQNYKTIAFDCDGVLLNSNGIKTEAFFKIAKDHYGIKIAKHFREYHIKNGGVSRYIKFQYLMTNILKIPVDRKKLSILLHQFSAEVKTNLLGAELAEGLDHLKLKTVNSKWIIISGGDQEELREVFFERGLENMFELGIYGSPDKKEMIFEREREAMIYPCLFIGDSIYDFLASRGLGLDFIFLYGWSELQDWKLFCDENGIDVTKNILSLLSLDNK